MTREPPVTSAARAEAEPTDIVAELERSVGEAMRMDAPLDARLKVIRDRVRALSTVFATAVDRMVERLENQAAGASAPAAGEEMPPFLLPDETGRLVSLAELIAEGPAAICFVRGHWCPYCRLNVMGLHEIEDEIRALGGRLAVIAPEKRKFTAALKSEAHAGFPILSDLDNGYALSLNLAIWVGAEMEALIAGAGWNVPDYNDSPSWMMPIPSAFIVRKDGIIAERRIDPDYRQRMDLDDLLAAVRSAR
jgi:peroxiredoxin